METLECQTRTGSLGPPYNIQLKVQCSYQQSRKLYKCFEDIRVSIRQQHIQLIYKRGKTVQNDNTSFGKPKGKTHDPRKTDGRPGL